MAKKAWTSSQFWQVWTLLAVLGTALASGRLLATKGKLRAPGLDQASAQPRRTTSPAVFATSPPPAAKVDPVLARLAVAATGAERCALLEQLSPSEDTQPTYAITAVLERAHLGTVRSCATRALGNQPTSEAQSFLVDLAEDPEPEVHRSALEALATRDEAARAVVVEATYSPDLELRVSAVKALLKAKQKEAYSAALLVLPLVEDAETLSSLIDALGESHDPQALPVLEALLENTERESHLHAISALGELGAPSAAVRLQSLLEVGSSEEFSAAAEALKKLRPEAVAPRLRALLASGNGERQELALSAMFSLDLPDLPAILRAQLRSGDPVRMNLVLRRLSRAPDPALEGDLVTLAEGSDRRWLLSAARALSELATPGARAALQRLASSLPESLAQGLLERRADDPTEQPAQRISNLTSTERVPASTLLELARDPSEGAQSALLRYLEGHEVDVAVWASLAELLPTSTVQRLADRRANAASSAQQGLLEGLGRRGDPSFTATLRADLRAAQPIRNAALVALIQLGDESAGAELERLVKDGDAVDRAFAVQLFRQRSDASAFQALERLGSDPDPNVMSSALQALQGYSPELVSKLAARALRDAAPEARATLLSSLGDLRPSLSRPLFELALKDTDDSVAVQAIQSLATLQGSASAERLLAVVNDSSRSEQVRAEAASSLRALGGPLARANRTLLDSLSEPEISGEFICTPSI